MTTAAILFPVGCAVARDQIPGLCARLAELLITHADATVVCDVGALAPDVVTAEALARLQLTARRHGRRLEMRGAGPELLGLLDLLGLRALLRPGGVRATIGPGALGSGTPGRLAQEPAGHAPAEGRLGSPPAAAGPQRRSAGQVGGQAEQREQPSGVEEVAHPGDAPG